MKKIVCRKTLLFLCALLFTCTHAWAAIGGGASVTVTLADGQEGYGSVYVMLANKDANGNVVPAMIDYSATSSYEYSDAVGGLQAQDSKNPAKQYFTLYAVPAHGKKFVSWNNSIKEPSRGLDGKICEGYSLTSNPLLLEVQYYGMNFNNWELKVSFDAVDTDSYEVTFSAPSGEGTYTASVSGENISMGANYGLYPEDYVSFSATPANGYFFYRYYAEDQYGNRTTLGQIALKNQLLQVPEGTVSVGAEFTNRTYAIVAGEGMGSFDSFKDAVQATRKADGTGYYGTILLLKDATLTAGNYTLPAGVSLIIPKDAAQIGSLGNKVPRVNDPTIPTGAYRTLTLAQGVNMDVYGELEVGCVQNIEGQGHTGTGRPAGETYGHLMMEQGSHITLMNGANLRAWGFVTGKGEIDARRGAVVQEQFQVMDWPGGSTGLNLVMQATQLGVFPINQYYIQNVEVPVTYRPGSKLLTSFGVYAAATNASMDNIGIIGSYYKNGDKDDAMFIMENEDDSEDTWVRKYYDVENDRQVYEINNSAKIYGMVIDLGLAQLNSRAFVLPITSNMTIHLLSGEMAITQNIELLPAAQIEVDKESTVTLESGCNLYLLDLYNWAMAHPVYKGYTPADQSFSSIVISPSYGFASQVNYTPSHGGNPNIRIAQTPDPATVMSFIQHWPGASVNVHGTFKVDGNVYTSQHDGNDAIGIGWANVYSNNEDAGTIIFNNTAPTDTSDVNVYNGQEAHISCAPAVLRHGDNSTHSTAGTESGSSLCYMNDRWGSYTHDGCFEHDIYNHYYAKPGEFVEVNHTPNSDHTYSDAAGAGRLFILMEDNCQWWEVENVDNLYHCIHPDNDTYYEYKDNKWQEKRFTITWNNWDGTPIETYSLPYGVTPAYRGTKPTRPANVDYHYDFDAWQPAPAPVTGDATYTATYTAEQIKHNIIFRFADEINGGAEIERQLLARDEMPVAPVITKTEGGKNWYVYWTPTVAAVTGPQTYIANWKADAPTEFSIRFQNYDGSELKTITVANGGTPEYDGATPVKPQTGEYTYTFTGDWQPAIAAATAPATYTAQFSESPRKYLITFQDEDGNTIETGEFAYGETPVCTNMPTKANTAQYTYSFAWDPQIQSVTGDATYKATFTPTTNRYTVKLMSNNDAVCTLTGAGIYDYGTTVNISATAADGYELVRWMEDGNTSSNRSVTVNGNITLTMQVKKTEAVENNINVAIGATKDFATAEDVTNLVISSNGSEAGQITHAENITLYGEADYDLTLNAAARTWYAVAVPWRVNAETGIYADGRRLTLGKDFDLIWYDGQIRATQGTVADCWRYVELESDHTMLPGRAYMIYLASPATTLRFRKAGRANLLNTDVQLTATDGNTSDQNANWNGIANPALYSANLTVGTNKAQYYDGDTKTYSVGSLNNMIVGKPAFVQVANGASVVVNSASNAPMRRSAQTSVKGEFELTLTNGVRRMDNLFVAIDEDKEADRYTIGSDLLKMGVSTTSAQMWINRYDARLCVNTMAPVDGTADFPLSLYTPAAGDYTIAVQSAPVEGMVIYLTRDGHAVWNLSEAPYTFSLNRGTDITYGLRISAAPSVVTSLDEALVEKGAATATKVLINDVIYILREGKVYTINGQVVE